MKINMIPRFHPDFGLLEFISIFKRNKNAVKQFEKRFAKKFKSDKAIAFPYGRSALWCFLKSLDIHDAEIILPSYTCSVVAHAIKLSGNIPVFVDVNLSDYNMNLNLLTSRINKKTKAIIATHLFGYPLDINEVKKIINKAESKYNNKIWLINDCAHSFGARLNNELVCNKGDISIYGLNISKLITCIFGGVLTLSDKNLAQKITKFRDKTYKKPSFLKCLKRRLYMVASYFAFSQSLYGITFWLQNETNLLKKLSDSYHLDDVIDFPPDAFDKMSPFEASIGIIQLKKYDEIIKKRIKNASIYDTYLRKMGIKNWVLPPIIEGSTYSHYVVRVPNRNKILDKFKDKGVELGQLIQYNLADSLAYKANELHENSALASKTTINFPIDISSKQVFDILKMIKDINFD